MEEVKYYDYTNNRPLILELDGCDLAEWDRNYRKFRFARHPKGFKVFLSPDRLTSSDEYAESDPYTVNIESPFHQRRIELTIELLQKAVPAVRDQARILDLGCGRGHITQAMFQKLNCAELTGLDYSVSAIEYAHENFPGIDFCVGDAYDPPYSEGYFDVVVCNNLWEHVPDPLRLLSKVNKLLKLEGYIIVSTPSRYRLGNIARIIVGKPVTLMSEHHVTEYSVGQVIEQFSYGGFRVKMILSRPIPTLNLKGKAARGLLGAWISLVGSHHQLESTVFYLAKKMVLNGEQDTRGVSG